MGADLNSIRNRDVTLHPALDYYRATLDFSKDVSGFPNSEGTFRYNFTFDPAIDDQVILEADLTLDMHVDTEHVALAG